MDLSGKCQILAGVRKSREQDERTGKGTARNFRESNLLRNIIFHGYNEQ